MMKTFTKIDIGIPGCYEIIVTRHCDERGYFVKTFHEEMFAGMGLATNFAEDFFSLSHRNVVRGLHFQLPPKDHAKLVYCTVGSVFDVLVDLRVGSPTFGEFRTFELCAEKATMLYLCPGVAHGFMATSSSAIVNYKVTTSHSPSHDAGIHWDSAGVSWPSALPTVSARDAAFPKLKDFISPFVFEIGGEDGN